MGLLEGGAPDEVGHEQEEDYSRPYQDLSDDADDAHEEERLG